MGEKIKEKMRGCELSSVVSGYGPVEDSYRLGNEPSDSVNSLNFQVSWVTTSFSRMILLLEVCWLLWGRYVFMPQFTLVFNAHNKAKQSHYTPRWRLGERKYSSYSFLTSALDGGEWSASRPGRALPRGKDPRYPLYRRLGVPQSRSGHRG
jgi:hypothetical protein